MLTNTTLLYKNKKEGKRGKNSLHVTQHYGVPYSKCAECHPKCDGAIICTIKQLLHLILIKIWGNRKYTTTVLNIVCS